MKYDVLRIESFVQHKDGEAIFTSEVYVNDKKVKGFVDVYGFMVDTHLMTPQQFYFYKIADKEFEQHNKSIKRFNGINSGVYLDSCSCGAPGCNGFYNGVRVYKKKNAYCYVALKKDGYKNGILETGKLNLCFTKENILNERKKLIDFSKKNVGFIEEYPIGPSVAYLDIWEVFCDK